MRQATNPDDFALRVSGIGGTSDSTWDSFDQSAGGGRPGMPPGAPQQAAPAPQAAPQGYRPPQQAQPQQQYQQPGQPQQVQYGQQQPAPRAQPSGAAPAAPGPGGDFEIERF
jgi:twitching motility protein PilT